MASSSISTLLSSSPSAINDLQQWLNQINKTFQNHLLLDTNLPVCIFKLPETITSEKPDSFIPQHIGLGPIHHFRTDLYAKQEQLKLTIAKTVLTPFKITSEFDKIVIESLKKLIPETRICYDLYFDVGDDVLAWVFALDALYLLNVLSKPTEGDAIESFKDVMMVENQIPLVILIELRNVLEVQSSGNSNTLFVSNLLVTFCETRSPLKFSMPVTQLHLDINSSFHLLDCMYLLIVNHNLASQNMLRLAEFTVDISLEDVENTVERASELCPCANSILQPVKLILKLPWDKIISFIKKILGENPNMIPSASKLSRIGKIEFGTTHGGIQDIEFDEKKLTFCLPILSLKSDSEVILRNLVAYEGLMFKKGSLSDLDFTEYMDLMCGLIDNVKDVKILCEKNIIEGDLGDDEIVKIFNEISKSSVKMDEKKSKLQKTVEKVNKHYNNMPIVKTYDFIKRIFLASWKIMVTVFAVLIIVLLIWVGVCQVYECKSRLGLGNIKLLFRYDTVKNQLIDF